MQQFLSSKLRNLDGVFFVTKRAAFSINDIAFGCTTVFSRYGVNCLTFLYFFFHAREYGNMQVCLIAALFFCGG